MRRANAGALLWSLLLGLAALSILYLFLSSKLALFIHPRMEKALALAVVMLLLLSVSTWRQVRSSETYSPISWGHILFLLPLLLALMYPPQMLTPEILSQKGLFGVLRGPVANLNEEQRPLPALAQDQTIVIDDENFISIMDALWSNTDTYVGREVEMLGFVYIDPVLGPQDFVLARLIMTCCAADAQMAGLLCRYPERNSLVPGQWITVRGTIGKLPYYNGAEKTVIEMPYLEVFQVRKVEKPPQEYIYP